jgi:hypothetical protein
MPPNAITPLEVEPALELGLRRLAEAAPSGEGIAAHVDYHELVATNLPGVRVDHVTGWVSPGALSLDPSSLPVLCEDPLDPGQLQVPLSGFWRPLRLWWLSATGADPR